MKTSNLKDSVPKLSNAEKLEKAEYLTVGHEQMYIVLHPTELPVRARVLLAGPFASERPHRYIPWVRWARYLASHGFEVMRFDYRGVGESTGRFEDYSFQSWSEDLRHCSNWLLKRSPSAPLVIHGLGMGALLGDRLFAQDIGNVLLAWLPPKSAREMLYDQLKIKMANNFILPANERKTRDQFINDLENGQVIEVEGHNWTPLLWSEAADFVFGDGAVSIQYSGKSQRSCYVGQLDALAAHTLGGVGPSPLRATGGGHTMRLVNPDLSPCFEETTRWLINTLSNLEAS